MLFNGLKLAWNEPMDKRFMFKQLTPWGLSAKFIGIYPRSQVSVYRTNGPLVKITGLFETKDA